MIYDLKSVQVDNFGSIKNGSFDFENKTYLLTAENNKDKGQKSNGGGKTTFIDAIAVSIFGFSLSGRSLKEYINFSESEFSTNVVLQSGESILEITRKEYRSKSKEVSILLNGAIPSGIPTKNNTEDALDVKEADKWIIDFFGIEKDDLLSYFLTAQGKYQSFYSYTSNKAIQFISRFSNYDILNDNIEKYDIRAKELTKEVESLENRLSSLETQISDQESFLSDLNAIDPKEGLSSIRESYVNQIIALNKELSSIDCEALELANKKISLTVESEKAILKDITANATVFKQSYSESVQSKKDKIEEYKLDIKKTQDIKQNLQSKIIHLGAMLENLITCPKCSHEFDVNSDRSEEDIRRELEGFNKDLEDMNGLTDSKEIAIENITKELEVLQDAYNKKKQEENEKYIKVQKHISDLNRSIEDGDYEINKYSKLTRELSSLQSKIDSLYSDVDSKIESKKGRIESTEDRIKNLKKDRLELSKEIKNKESESIFNKENSNILEKFKFDLINDQISFISNNINRNLELQDSDIKIQIDGFKKDSKGKIREQINPTFYRTTDPDKVRGYHSFSGGEKGKLDLASDILFQDMINKTANNGLNLLLSDEIFSTIDELGIENICKNSINFDKTMIFVSHSANDLTVENEIKLCKNEKGVTSIF